MTCYLKLRNRRTGEWFRSKRFETLEAAIRWGDHLDLGEWDWSIVEA